MTLQLMATLHESSLCSDAANLIRVSSVHRASRAGYCNDVNRIGGRCEPDRCSAHTTVVSLPVCSTIHSDASESRPSSTSCVDAAGLARPLSAVGLLTRFGCGSQDIRRKSAFRCVGPIYLDVAMAVTREPAAEVATAYGSGAVAGWEDIPIARVAAIRHARSTPVAQLRFGQM